MTFTEFSELRLNLTVLWLPDIPYLALMYSSRGAPKTTGITL